MDKTTVDTSTYDQLVTEKGREHPVAVERFQEPVETNVDQNQPLQDQLTNSNEEKLAAKAEKAMVQSYFFTMWNARADSWAISLFLSLLFPDTLLPISIYSFACSISCLIFGPVIGWIVDHSSRLHTVSFGIITQKILICSSAFLLLLRLGFTFDDQIPPHLTLDWHFYVLVLNGSMLQVANLISRIAIERDWSKCVAEASHGQILLARLNSRLRFIDLVADLAAPVVISAVASFLNIQWGMIFVLGVSALSIPLEWTKIRFIYALFPALAQKSISTSQTKLEIQILTKLWKLPVITTCFSVSVLYLSVMTINTVSISYLLFKNTDIMAISVARGISVLSGILSTYSLEKMIHRIGLKSTGLVAIWYQCFCIGLVALSFYLPQSSATASIAMFLVGICLSRWGLWTFDLVQQQLLQENVPQAYLGIVSGAEISLQNVFQMTAYALTIIWTSPTDFWIPSHISAMAVLTAALLYSYYVISDSGSNSEMDPLLGDSI
ncbi:Ferroporti-1 [Gorgonomyces haynaldii]|nr:Ferroporti-1 [Gorgonomyces haynaldii]